MDSLSPLQLQWLLRFGVFLVEILLAATLMVWLRHSQRGTRDSWRFLATLVVWGGATALLAGIVEIRYSIDIPRLERIVPELVDRNRLWYELVNIGGTSLIEETAKYVVAVFALTIGRHYRRLSDAIAYSILIGLGFALFEDILFLIDPEVIAPYRLLSFYMHAGTAAMIGYSLGRFAYGLGKYRQVLLSLLTAIGLHAAYNVASGLHDLRLATGFTLVIALYLTLQVYILYEKALAEECDLDRQSCRLPTFRLLNVK